MRVPVDVYLDARVPEAQDGLVEGRGDDAVVVERAQGRRVEEPVVQHAQDVVRVRVEDEEVAR